MFKITRRSLKIIKSFDGTSSRTFSELPYLYFIFAKLHIFFSIKLVHFFLQGISESTKCDHGQRLKAYFMLSPGTRTSL